MTNRREFLRSSPLIIAGSTVTGAARKAPETAMRDETGTGGFVQRVTNSKSMESKNLRIADGSIMPHITTGNTMAPYVIIGERAGEMVKTAHGILGEKLCDE